MDVIDALQEIEDSFNEQEANDIREQGIAALTALHMQIVEEDPENLDRFLLSAADSLGGIYLPYVFWYKLGEFYENDEYRVYLQELMRIFGGSNFEEEEQRKMKPLLVAYLAKEKEFELDKIKVLIVDKMHPTVKEYYYKLIHFVEKNQKATQMYIDKFNLLKDYQPNFELLALPVTRLKEVL